MTFALYFWLAAYFAACALAVYTGTVMGLIAAFADEWRAEQDFRYDDPVDNYWPKDGAHSA